MLRELWTTFTNMTNWLLIVIALVWWVGACVRIFQHIRFFQIEEYMPLRYLRWVFSKTARWLPTRATLALFVGGIVSTFIGDTIWVTGIILVISAAVVIYPYQLAEVKKGFKRTDRATRLLASGFGLALLPLVGMVAWTLNQPLTDWHLIALGGVGWLVWWMAPDWLVLANWAMFPVEEGIRQRFRHQARRRLRTVGAKVIGITGSYGKTSTKQYLEQILNARYRAFATPKSWNTLMGVCLAINTRMNDDAEYFICEMGAYVPGEIAQICQLTHPQISILTEIGPQHLERFKSLENTARAKYELVKALPADGVALFNLDNPYLVAMYERPHPATRLGVSLTGHPAARLIATNMVESADGLAFDVTDRATEETIRFETQLLGTHNITNLLLASALALHEGITLKEIARRVRAIQPSESRLVKQVTPNGITIINDAYSANPVGARSAIRVLGLHEGGRRLLITPGMIELGELQTSENFKLGEYAVEYVTDVILVGIEQTKPIYDGLLSGNFERERIIQVETLTNAIEWYRTHLVSGDTVLFLNDLPDTY